MAFERLDSDPTERGFALLIVLWMLVTLFVLGAEFAQGMRQDATATVNFAHETRSYYLATAAANRVFHRALIARDSATLGETQGLLEDQEPLVYVDGEWRREELWDAPVWVRVTDEAGKIPINHAEENLLRMLFGNMGLDFDAASSLSDSILDWIDRDDEHRLNGAESEYYRGLPQPYVAKNASINSLNELLLIKGVTPDMFYGETEEFPVGLRDLFTVHNRFGTINVRTMSEEVMQVFFALDDEELEQILDARQQDPNQILLFLQEQIPDPSVSGVLSNEPPNVMMVEAQARVPGARVGSHVGGVIDIGESNEGIYVLRWFDQLPMAPLPDELHPEDVL